ncbi:putative capsular polysaccharide biosynthesis protein,Glycosyl Transferase Family 2, YveT [Lachnospiraceae bacterium TWA4]|nr:putative capsular polysaccharide biosynthesis protein,Glycosyl Transferase Family 2, YveT [Lachnospiraceae bacterium TWA4]
MNEILISIIVPAYNIEEYIGRCLDSIIAQTHKNLEIVVVDDGSTDNTGKILDEFALRENRLIVIHKENGGVSSAREIGIEHAKGTYIGFVDGDDYIEPEMYENLLENALEYKADISHCGYQMIYPDGHIVKYYGTRKIKLQNRKNGIEDLLRGDFIEPGLCNKLYKRKIVLSYLSSDIWDKAIKINEDFLMNYIFFKEAKKSIYEDITPYHYILRKGSAATTKKSYNQVFDPYKVISLIKSDIDEQNEAYSIVYERYIRMLIALSTQNDYKNEAIKAKGQLRKEMRMISFKKNCKSLKLRRMSFGVVNLYPVYMIVRKIYDKITKCNQRYDLK